MALFHGKLIPGSEFAVVIMAGGSGTRFWPKSRTSRPKQYLELCPDGRSLLRASVDRVAQLAGVKSIMVVTAASQIDLVREHAPNAAILAEPLPRNTAPCLGYAARKILSDLGDIPIVSIPADHLIQNDDGYREVLTSGLELVREEDAIVTVGLKPTYPETGFGYIKASTPFPNSSGVAHALRVDAFVEKPTIERAEEYLRSGHHFWNGGIFLFRPSVLLAEISKQLPNLSKSLEEISALLTKPNTDPLISDIFGNISPISIDFGVMEKAANVVVIPGTDFSWSDVGSWHSWADALKANHDKDGNLVVGDSVAIDCRNIAVWSSEKFVAAIGVEDLVVVETEDAILVCKRDRSQDVRRVVEILKEKKRNELL